MKRYICLDDIDVWDVCGHIKGCPQCDFDSGKGCMIYEWVNNLPTIEVSEDCISRKWLEENKQVVIHTNDEWGETEINEYIYWEDVENAPSVIPKRSCYRCGLREDCEDSTERKPREGEWIIDDEEYGRIWQCHCSNCKKDPQDYIGGTEDWWLVHLPNNCPHCGAKIKGE